MNTKEGYSKLKLDDTNVLLTKGGHKSLSDFVMLSDLTSYLPITGGTVTGATSFSSPISGNLLGNATTADRLKNAVSINGYSFDGSSDITLPFSDYLPLAGGKMTGHLYLGGINADSSSSSTTQIVLGTSTTQYSSITGNKNGVIINPSTSSTTGQIVLKPGSSPSITVNGTAVSLVGHTHTKSNITDFPTNISSFTNDSGYLTNSNLYEAKLNWGGRNFSGSFGVIDASLVGILGANRTAFVKASSITIEYSRDGGTTWTDYEASDSLKIGFFTDFKSAIYIGKASSTDIATNQYQTRIILNTHDASVYTTLNKFIIYISTNGTSDNWCTIDARLLTNVESDTDTWVTFASQIAISGWSGYNVINTSKFTTYGNTKDSQYGQLRFTFGCTTGSTSSHPGLCIYGVNCYGGVGWSTPSTLAKTGNIYSYDTSQNITFPGSITTSSTISSKGGTLTGHLRLNGVTSSSTANTSQIIFQKNTTEYAAISATNNNLIVFNSSSTSSTNLITFYLGSDPYITVGGSTKKVAMASDISISGTGLLTSGTNIGTLQVGTSTVTLYAPTAGELTSYTLPTAGTGTLGGIKIWKDILSYTVSAQTTSTISSNITSGNYYGVEIDANDQAFVYVPWTDTHYTTHLYVGDSDTATSNASGTYNTNTYLSLCDNTTHRNSVQLLGTGGITITSQNGHIEIGGGHSTNLTLGSYGLSSDSTSASVSIPYITIDGCGRITEITTHTYTPPSGGDGNGSSVTYTDVATGGTRTLLGTLTIDSEDYSLYVPDIQDILNNYGALTVNNSWTFTNSITVESGIIGRATEADKALVSNRLGTETIGSSSIPIYLSAGSPIAFSSTIGGPAAPIYIKNGGLTALTETVGDSNTPVYLSSGEIKVCTPMYQCAYCNTDGSTATKNVLCIGFVNTSISYLNIIMGRSNESASALLLIFNGDSTTTYDIYINGLPSSSTNYSLPAGGYIVLLDTASSKCYFNTEGKIPYLALEQIS